MSRWGLDSEMLFHRAAGRIEQAGGYTVVCTPDNPDFYFGNLLVLDAAPSDADRGRLEADFAARVGTPPRIQHRTFMWPVASDAAAPEVAGFVADGYVLQETVVMLAEAVDLVAPARPHAGLEIRAFRDDADWDAWTALNVADDGGRYPEDSYRRHLDARQRMYRQLSEQGRGGWHGAWLDGRLVAQLGLYFEGATGRFQAVLTDAAHRGRGVCRTLVHRVAEQGFERAERLVMLADEHEHARRIYASLGFAPRERLASLCWWPRG